MQKYIPRRLANAINGVMPYYQVIVVTGPRQSGKSTLCRHLFSDYPYYNLEDLSLRDRAKEDPKGFLQSVGDCCIIDEVQNLPELLSYIQVMVDANPGLRFVLTGSSNFSLMQSVTQSLAGRAAVFTLLPFSMRELGQYAKDTSINDIMFNGFYPAIFSKKTPPTIFYGNYNTTYVERDVRQLIELKNQDRFIKFLRLCALRIGTELNMADMAKSVGVSAPTISEWLSILKASYIVFTMQPYYANIQKRLTKTPKLYFYDTGLAAYLMGLTAPEQLDLVAVKGALFENTAILELMKGALNDGKSANLMFYRENSGKEVDIVDDHGLFIDIYEVKSSSTFKAEYTANLNYLKTLLPDNVRQATVIYNGDSQPPSILNIRDL